MKNSPQEMFTHICIRLACAAQYESADPDPYYCPECEKKNKIIAADIDRKLKDKPRKQTLTPLQEYDAAQKVHGFMRVKLEA